ncbi:hypothetical protein [Cognatilysobacter lacus]|uniref:Uncharacterized protein n=1 Tax=Cognatilysobacter lacus TaxID=1643323 RepID=A0A5D8YZU6_9GAMM|nr:hypothetical protein [Lysobacter lacus]TZF87776.1 hypothetical protein FW784_10655 [Lysobacter lacus]
MKKTIAALSLSLCPLLAIAGPGIRFDTVLLKAGKPEVRQSTWVPFGQEAVIEIPGKVRVVVSAQTPSGERSRVKGTLYRFSGGKWVQEWAPDMQGDLSKTPSFEKDLQGTAYHVVVMPRAANEPSSSGS